MRPTTNYPAIYHPTGYYVFEALRPHELQKLRRRVEDKYYETIRQQYADVYDSFRERPINKYHEVSHLIDHARTWVKGTRGFTREEAEAMMGFSIMDRLRELVGPFEVFGETDLGWPDFYYRLIRPNATDDIGPLHADRWFHELGNGIFPDDVTICKVWIPLWCQSELNGLVGLPTCDPTHELLDYDAVLREGMIKPEIRVPEGVDVPVAAIGVEPGQAITFTNDFVHGGQLNRADDCRVSLEFTIMLPVEVEKTRSLPGTATETAADAPLPVSHKQADQILPVQPVLDYLYQGPPDEYYERLWRQLSGIVRCEDPGEVFDLELPDGVEYCKYGSSLHSLYFLQMLIRIGEYKHILEIGTFIGVSAMILAQGMAADGKVTTIEQGREFAEIAVRNFARNGFADRIQLLRADAGKLLRFIVTDLDEFDVVFLDGNKEHYDVYFDALFPRVRPGGLFVVDDALFHGDVLNDRPSSLKGAGVKRLLDKVAQNSDLTSVMLPLGNGLLLVQKQRDVSRD